MLEQLNDVIAEQMETWSIPGLAIAALHDGNVETATYGIANIETGASVVPETLFQIGSISKIFTQNL